MSCAGCEDCSLIQIGKAQSPFEIHITVDKNTDPETFKRVCLENDIKPLFIDNHTPSGNPIRDMMTRSIVKGTIEDAGNEIFRVSITLLNAGIKSIRSKVETVPWIYDQVKDFSSEQNVPYFETHIEILNSNFEISDIVKIARKYGGYVSQNISKSNVVMMTFRLDHIDEIGFRIYAKRMREILESSGFELGREIIELTFHDDNKAHDDEWMNGI